MYTYVCALCLLKQPFFIFINPILMHAGIYLRGRAHTFVRVCILNPFGVFETTDARCCEDSKSDFSCTHVYPHRAHAHSNMAPTR